MPRKITKLCYEDILSKKVLSFTFRSTDFRVFRLGKRKVQCRLNHSLKNLLKNIKCMPSESRQIRVEKGQYHIKKFEFPMNERRRRFLSFKYIKILINMNCTLFDHLLGQKRLF